MAESQSTHSIEPAVFVDHAGRRHHIVRLAVAGAAALIVLWLAALAAGLFGFDALPGLRLPAIGSESGDSRAGSDHRTAGKAGAHAGANGQRAAASLGASQGSAAAGGASRGSSPGTAGSGTGSPQSGGGTAPASGGGGSPPSTGQGGGSTPPGSVQSAGSSGRGAPTDHVPGAGRGRPETTPNGNQQPGN